MTTGDIGMTNATPPAAAGLIAEFRRRLLDARKALFRTIGATDEELAALNAQEPGGPPEQATAVAAAALLSRLEGQEKHELDDIVDALTRLEGGAYGLCQSCGCSIPLTRLRAMPATRYCVGCQVGREQRP